MEKENSQNLKWEITPIEKRQRNQQALILFLKLSPIIIGIMATGIAKVELSLRDFLYAILYAILFFWGIILFALIINKIYPFSQRIYLLDNQRITISKGRKKISYLWSDFEYFYEPAIGYYNKKSSNYSDSYSSIYEDVKSAEKEMKTIEGRTFYLKRKSSNFLSKFYKIFVVVYSEPDNSENVLEFLRICLSHKQQTLKNDLGLIIYKFK